MARTVADVALLLSAIAGPDPRVADRDRRARRALRRPLDRDFRGMRIAWSRDLGGLPIDPRVSAVVDAQRPTFEALGCAVEDGAARLRGRRRDLQGAGAPGSSSSRYAPLRRAHRHQIKDTIIWNIEQGQKLTGPQLARAERKRTALYHRVREFMDDVRVPDLPASQVPPFDVTQPYVTEINGVPMETYIDWMRVVLRHLGHRPPGHLGAVRLHARGPARRRPDRRAAPGRAGGCSSSPTPSSRPPGSGSATPPSPTRPRRRFTRVVSAGPPRGARHAVCAARLDTQHVTSYVGLMPLAREQPNLFGRGEPGFDPGFSGLRRLPLARGAWVDHQPGWIEGHEAVFAALWSTTRWRLERRRMYERVVDVPRFFAMLPEDGPGHPLLPSIATALSARYGRVLSEISLAGYRDGRDSVAFHGDRVGARAQQHDRGHRLVRRTTPLPAETGGRRRVARLRSRLGRSPRDGGHVSAHVGARRAQDGERGPAAERAVSPAARRRFDRWQPARQRIPRALGVDLATGKRFPTDQRSGSLIELDAAMEEDPDCRHRGERGVPQVPGAFEAKPRSASHARVAPRYGVHVHRVRRAQERGPVLLKGGRGADKPSAGELGLRELHVHSDRCHERRPLMITPKLWMMQYAPPRHAERAPMAAPRRRLGVDRLEDLTSTRA